MKCLNCDRLIDESIVDEFEIYECDCGIKYSMEHLNKIEINKDLKENWEHIRKNKLFKRNGSTLQVYKVYDKFVSPEEYEKYQKQKNEYPRYIK